METYIKDGIKKHYDMEVLISYRFGSRARGDINERSDWDFAIESDREITEFMLEIRDEAPTLCGVDIIFFNSATSELKEEILKPGGWQIGVTGFGEFLPYDDNRVTLSKDKKDKWGLPQLDFDVEFNSLFAITNIPIRSYLDYRVAR
mgnify:CR=1 FL=1